MSVFKCVYRRPSFFLVFYASIVSRGSTERCEEGERKTNGKIKARARSNKNKTIFSKDEA